VPSTTEWEGFELAEQAAGDVALQFRELRRHELWARRNWADFELAWCTRT